MKKYILSDDLGSAIYNYLLSRPMKEVEGMVEGLRNLPVVPDESENNNQKTEA